MTKIEIKNGAKIIITIGYTKEEMMKMPPKKFKNKEEKEAWEALDQLQQEWFETHPKELYDSYDEYLFNSYVKGEGRWGQSHTGKTENICCHDESYDSYAYNDNFD